MSESMQPGPTNAQAAVDAIRAGEQQASIDRTRAAEWVASADEALAAQRENAAPAEVAAKLHERTQSFEDMNNYLAERPEVPVGKAYWSNKTHYEDSHEGSIEDRSLNDLISDWAGAEDSNDSTRAMDVQDEIERRLTSEENMSDDLKMNMLDRIISKKDALRQNQDTAVENNAENNVADSQPVGGGYGKKGDEIIQDGGQATNKKSESDDLWDRLNKIPDLEKPDRKKGDKPFNEKTFEELVDDNPDIARDLLENGAEGGKKPLDKTQKMDQVNPDYDGPVKPGQEVELWKKPEIEQVDPELQGLQNTLKLARDEYVRISAYRRGKLFSRKESKKDLEAAKKAYDDAHDAIGAYTAKQMETQDLSADEIRMNGAAGAIFEDLTTTKAIIKAQEGLAEGKRFKGFYNFWARQNGKITTAKGIRGAIVKSGVMKVLTLPAGIVAGAAGAALLGPVAGALVGAGIAKGIASGLMGANIAKNASESVARAQGMDAFYKNEARINDLAANGAVISGAESSAGTMEQTRDDTIRNRKRMGKAALIGAAGGAAGAFVGNIIQDRFFDGGGNGGNAKGGNSGAENTGGKGGKPDVDLTENLPDATPLGTVGETGAGAAGAGPVELFPTDSRLPWEHVNDLLGNLGDTQGGANSTPAIFELVERGKQYGINFVGEGRGIKSVTVNGQTFTDNAHINSAFDETLRRVLLDEAAKTATTA